jgi:hypothetical protein
MRKQTYRSVATWIVAIMLLLSGVGKAVAAFIFTSESAVFNAATGNVQFTVEFNQVPDFVTVGPFGQRANSFQYFIIGDPSLEYPALYDAIIRGEEITADSTPDQKFGASDSESPVRRMGNDSRVSPLQSRRQYSELLSPPVAHQ